MLRSQKRLLQEYVVTAKKADARIKLIQDKKRLKSALDDNRPVPTDLRSNTELRNTLDLEDEKTINNRLRDDEYRDAGKYVPKIAIITSLDPTRPCVRFTKELSLLLPNSDRMNRGGLTEAEIIEICGKSGVTDVVEIGGGDKEGRPSLMKVIHLPFGPCALFTIRDVVMRSDLTEKVPQMSLALPNLIFHQFTSLVGQRFGSILKHLFPMPEKRRKKGKDLTTEEASRRVITFANVNDLIVVRHHNWERTSTVRKFHGKDPALESMTEAGKRELMNRVEVREVGPRFTLEPYKIVRGTSPDEGDVEWMKASFIRKRAPIL